MDEVRYAEPAFETSGDPERDGAGLVDSLMQRAVGEQLAEQRLLRDALTDVSRRLEALERSLEERSDDGDSVVADRLDRFERAVSERMTAFETVVKRLVDRLETTEERLVEGLAHNDRVVRAQLEALRPAIGASEERIVEAVETELGDVVRRGVASSEERIERLRETLAEGFERTSEAVGHSERVLEAQFEALRPTVEAAVLGSVNPELDRAVDELRQAISEHGRKLAHDVNRIGSLLAREGPSIEGVERVGPASEEATPEGGQSAADRRGARVSRRRRRRPLVARRVEETGDDEETGEDEESRRAEDTQGG